MNSRQDA